jgi:hypothetical protein
MQLTAPTLSSPADGPTATNVVYTITSTTPNDDKIILDLGTANFTYQSVSVGTASKVGNTVECIGFTTNNPAVTIQFTAEATYSVTAKSVNIAGTYGTSPDSTADSITIVNAYAVNFLCIGGGGGSAMGGGGAGGYRNSFSPETSGGGGSSEATIGLSLGVVYTITVGAGGAGCTTSRIPTSLCTGGDTTITGSGFSTFTADGGGFGGGNITSIIVSAGGDGGSGGGGGAISGTYALGGSGTTNQGYDGGGGRDTGPHMGGGGGGASAAGADGVSAGGAGGNGLASSITASSVTRGGGGGGGAYATGAGSGGTGGGGNGVTGATGNAGTVNTGGGAGGHTHNGYPSSAGGSGIVVLRIPNADYSGTTSGSPTIDTSSAAGTTILIYNGDGTYTG